MIHALDVLDLLVAQGAQGFCAALRRAFKFHKSGALEIEAGKNPVYFADYVNRGEINAPIMKVVIGTWEKDDIGILLIRL